MAKKLTEKALKKKLQDMDREALIQLVLDLYRSDKSVEQSINLRLVGEAYGNELLEKYKKKLCKMFDPSRAVQRGFSIEDAQRILREFAAVCANDTGRWYGDLALYFAECATNFTMDVGDIDEAFYDALREAYRDAVVAASKDEELYKLWKDRLEGVLHAFDGFGWGMGEYISEAYYELPWVQKSSGISDLIYTTIEVSDMV